jgi:hypothetical protein
MDVVETERDYELRRQAKRRAQRSQRQREKRRQKAMLLKQQQQPVAKRTPVVFDAPPVIMQQQYNMPMPDVYYSPQPQQQHACDSPIQFYKCMYRACGGGESGECSVDSYNSGCYPPFAIDSPLTPDEIDAVFLSHEST